MPPYEEITEGRKASQNKTWTLLAQGLDPPLVTAEFTLTHGLMIVLRNVKNLFMVGFSLVALCS